MKVKIEIKNVFTGKILFEYEKENNTIKDTVVEANLRGANLYEADLYGANLRGANLRGADLRGANLYEADLRGANLYEADLYEADLRGANLRGANLRGADLRGANLYEADLYEANLEPIKNDMFAVMLRAIPEVARLRQNIVDGKIDGSCYEGECCCLNGTLTKGTTNGTFDNLRSIRDSNRPIERFFLAIKPGDTPETSQFSKLAVEWLDEFVSFIPVPTIS